MTNTFSSPIRPQQADALGYRALVPKYRVFGVWNTELFWQNIALSGYRI